jgi:hypothetical protein
MELPVESDKKICGMFEKIQSGPAGKNKHRPKKQAGVE